MYRMVTIQSRAQLQHMPADGNRMLHCPTTAARAGLLHINATALSKVTYENHLVNKQSRTVTQDGVTQGFHRGPAT